LLAGAEAYARGQGAALIEAYPVDTGQERVQAASIFTGAQAMFLSAGYTEIARRAPKRPILRKELN
jgi:hypothetical protein